MANQGEKAAPSDEAAPRSILRPVFICSTIFLWFLCLAWIVFPASPETVERYYSLLLYRWAAALIVPITQSTEVSVFFVVAVLVAIGFPFLWFGRWLYLRNVKNASHLAGLLWGVKWLLFILPLAILWFYAAWGTGYRRTRIEDRLELDTAEINAQEALELRTTLLDVINENMLDLEDRNVSDAVEAISASMSRTVETWDGKSVRLPSNVKTTPDGLLLLNGTFGFCAPFTLEAHVDGALPDTAFVYTAAHELAHIAGMCGEAEASLLGFVAGLSSSEAYARYAVALKAYVGLAKQLEADEQRRAMELLPETALNDLRLAAQAREKYAIDWFDKSSSRVYDKFLRSQGVKEGVKDYSRASGLFLYAWRKGLVSFTEIVPDEAETATTYLEGLE